MPLRLLLVRSIALIFIATLVLSTVLVFWRTYEKVEADMTAALAGGQRAVFNAADETDGPAPATDGPRYTLLLSTDASLIDAAQRLRHQVFTSEPGYALAGAPDGRDADPYVQRCGGERFRDKVLNDARTIAALGADIASEIRAAAP